MSLIDEALKRAQAAHDEERQRENEARPWTPPPLPDPRRIARGRTRAIVWLALAAAVLAVTAGWLLRQAGERAASAASPASRAVQSASRSAGLPPISSEVTVAPPPRGVPASGPGLQRAPSPMRTPAFALEPGAGSSASRRPGSSSTSSPPSAAPPPAGALAPVHPDTREPKARGTGEPRSYAGEMPLPGGGKITLDGIAYSETSPIAVVNGKIVAPGGYVEGFTVVKILPDRVELEAEGSRAFLTLR